MGGIRSMIKLVCGVYIYFLGLSQTQAKFEYLIFIDEPSSNTHYLAKLGSFTALSYEHKFIHILDEYNEHTLYIYIYIYIKLRPIYTIKYHSYEY